MRIATQQYICVANQDTAEHSKNFCSANQERENQTMAPQSPTFWRVSI